MGTEACDNCGVELGREESIPPVEPVAPLTPVAGDVPAAAGEEPASGTNAPSEPRTQQRQKTQQPKQTQQKQPGKMQPELFIRDGMIRIQMKIWQAVAFSAIGLTAIVLIISYIAESGARQPSTAAQQPSTAAQQQMQGQGQQAPAGPSLDQINAARKAVEAKPNDEAAILNLSHLLHDARMFDQAIVMYQRYLRINPDNPDAQVDLGVCYFSLGQYDAAKKEMLEAVGRHPDHQLGHFNLGIVTLAKGDTTESREWLRKTIAMNPGSTVSRNAETILTRIQTGP
jgi:Tfp pilus assembly protein PilF